MINWLKQKFGGSQPAANSTSSPASKEPGKGDVDLLNKSGTYANMGEIHLEEGQLRQAAECFQKALSIYPNNAGALAGLGLVYLRQEMPREAEGYFQQAISITPTIPIAHYFLGHFSSEREHWNEAIQHFKAALELRPDMHVIYRDLAYALFRNDDLADAQAVIDQGLAANQNIAEFHLLLGNLQYLQQQPEAAIASYQKAISLQPDAGAFLNLGRVYFDQGKIDVATICYRKAIAIKPDFIDAYYNLALSIKSSDMDEAIALLRRVVSAQTGHIAAKATLTNLLMRQCSWDGLADQIIEIRQSLQSAPVSDNPQASPFLFFTFPGTTPAELRLCAEKWAQREYRQLETARLRLAFQHPPRKQGKISIGYLSEDFREHPVAYMIAETFELHDRGNFMVHAYSYGVDDGSPVRRRLEKAFDKFVDIRNMSNAEAAIAINRDQIDILIDLTGYTGNNRAAILALRAAPIQVNFLGFAGTMGVSFVDYIIADEFVIPAHSRQYYSEQVAVLPNSFMPCDTTRARPSAPSRAENKLPDSGFVFCCFNNTYKVTPEMFDIWCKLLTATPGSVLWLSGSNSQALSNLQNEAAKRQVDPSRIIMAPRVERIEDHLARIQLADLFLDTAPYNAHSTCSDALWMGVPLITCSGESFQSRVAGSMLRAIELPELVTFNLEDYFSLALDLATNPARLKDIRQKLDQKRDSAPLFDSERFTRNLEHLYSEMYQTIQ